jgi:hypothetical protein
MTIHWICQLPTLGVDKYIIICPNFWETIIHNMHPEFLAHFWKLARLSQCVLLLTQGCLERKHFGCHSKDSDWHSMTAWIDGNTTLASSWYTTAKVQKQTHIEMVTFWVIYDLHEVHNVGMVQLLHNRHLDFDVLVSWPKGTSILRTLSWWLQQAYHTQTCRLIGERSL